MADCVAALHAVFGAASAGELLRAPEIVSACMQAAAIEHAARIQATAARQAGTMTLVAGMGAVAGGAFTIMAAWLQLRPMAAERRFRSLAYRQHLSHAAVLARAEIDGLADRLSAGKIAALAGSGALDLPVTTELQAELSIQNWERHALFGTRFPSVRGAYRAIAICFLAREVFQDGLAQLDQPAALRGSHSRIEVLARDFAEALKLASDTLASLHSEADE